MTTLQTRDCNRCGEPHATTIPEAFSAFCDDCMPCEHESQLIYATLLQKGWSDAEARAHAWAFNAEQDPPAIEACRKCGRNPVGSISCAMGGLCESAIEVPREP